MTERGQAGWDLEKPGLVEGALTMAGVELHDLEVPSSTNHFVSAGC